MYIQYDSNASNRLTFYTFSFLLLFTDSRRDYEAHGRVSLKFTEKCGNSEITLIGVK